MKSIEGEWEHYRNSACKGKSDSDLVVTKRAFFAGAAIVFKNIGQLLDQDDDEVIEEWFDDREDELVEFAEKTIRELGQRN
jgi:hypothetical protein